MYSIWLNDEMMWYQGADDPDFALSEITLEEEVNKAGSLQFTIPVTNTHYNAVKTGKMYADICVKYAYFKGVTEDIMWRGRILYDERDFDNSRKVYCEGQLSFLMDSIVRSYSETLTPKEMLRFYLDQHNAQVKTNQQFLMGSTSSIYSDSTIYRASTQYPTTFDEITEKLLNTVGGYLIPEYVTDQDKWKINYLSEYNRRWTPYDINFGENLLDVSITVTGEDYYNRIIPLGATDQTTGEKLTIKSVTIGGVDYIETNINGIDTVSKVVEWDDVTNALDLYELAQRDLSNHNDLTVNYKINAISAHYFVISDQANVKRIMLGDMVHVKSEPHDLDLNMMVTKINHNLEDPSQTEYTFGASLKTLSDYYL